MQPIQLFDLASRQAEWLSVRQQVVAGNIANANTPKFHAKDVTPFEAVLNNQTVGMARTNPAHLSGTEMGSTDKIGVEEASKPGNRCPGIGQHRWPGIRTDQDR